MRLMNLLRSLVVCLALFVCFSNAADVAVAHVIYDGNGLYYADNESNLRYKALTKGDDGMFTIGFTNERLDNGKKDLRKLRFGLICSDGTCKTDLNAAQQPYLGELFPNYKDGDEEQPVYHVWIVINGDGTLGIYDKKPNIQIVIPGKKTIRVLPPWSNTSAIMYVNGSENYMTPVESSYCGWFESKLLLDPKDVYVSFKQTIGNDYIGKNGIELQPISIEDEILLDSALQQSDTVWISAKLGAPEIYTSFPGELGDCPIKTIPVMVFDWLHGDGDGKNGYNMAEDDAINAKNQAGTTNQDFGTGGCVQVAKGMVEETLGSNGVPVRAANFPENCKLSEHLDNWFLPEIIAHDAQGNAYTNATCRDLELKLDDEGFWLGEKNKRSPEKGLFLLDDFQYLDSAKTVLNPNFDWIDGDNGGTKNIGFHNYGYTMKIQAQFEYVKGQYFEFYGDDDVWVFINNKLVVDIGGQHQETSGSVNLDKLGLEEGKTYPFHIFYAERHKDESNFKMRTSIDLRTDASMFLEDLPGEASEIIKQVWQIIRERTLACDFNASPENIKNELGPSNFVLYGKGVAKGGVALKELGTYYEGITISNNFTQIKIDPKAIAKAQSLPPGTYYIRVSLKTNSSEYKDIYFTVDPYELPNLAFASVKDSAYCILNFVDDSEGSSDSICFNQYWHPFGDEISRNVSSDTLPINLDKNEKMWAGRSYPVNVMYAEDWAIMYSGIPVSISSTSPNLVACDSMGNIITEVLLADGKASFFVKALDEIVNGTLTIKSPGAKNASVDWKNINIAVPPVPPIDSAFIYDRNGDGRGDSIWVSFKKPLGGQSVLDSIKFVFGNSFDTPYKASYVEGEKIATFVAKGDGFGSAIFTGGATSPYNGKITAFYTYTDESGQTSIFDIEGSLYDRIGPVIVAAEVEYMSDGNTLLKLTFSEGVSDANASIDLFNFHCWKDNILETNVKTPGNIGVDPANQWNLVFTKGASTDIVPSVGDSVKFTVPSFGGQALDLLGNLIHEGNPWVRITGEQKVTVTSPKVVTLNPASDNFDSAKAIIRSETPTVPKLVVSDTPLNAEEVAAKFGTQGHYLGDLDMSQLVENEIAEIVKAIQSTSSYVDKKAPETTDPAGNPITPPAKTIEQIINEVAAGTMSISEAKKRYDISEVIVDAYENGLLTKDNLHYYSSGSESDIKQIVSKVADKTVLTYRTFYYTSLGHYVSSNSGTITCNADIFKEGGRENCLDTDGKLFLAWNMRADNGRLAASGVYIARLEIKIRVNSKTITNRTQDFLWGVRRGRVNAIDLGL